MKQVVWIFGTSASGKQTFIKSVMADKTLQKSLDLGGKSLAVCQESIDLLGNVGNKEIVVKRKIIAAAVPKLLKGNVDVVLIKWQYIDSYNRMPQKLKELLPNAKHRIILLQVSADEIKARLAKKNWWKRRGMV